MTVGIQIETESTAMTTFQVPHRKVPWTEHVLDFMRRFMRFILWCAVFLNGLMLAVFLIIFTLRFLQHLWSWCSRVLFPGSW